MAEELTVRVVTDTSEHTAVLIADAAQSSQTALVQTLICDGYRVLLAPDMETVERHIQSERIGYCVTELKFDGGSAEDVLRKLAAHHPRCRTIVHSAHCNLATAVAMTRAGAADVLPKPVATDFLLALLFERDLHTPDDFSFVQKPNVVREEHIRQTLVSCGANISRTAHRLSIHKRTLQRILKRSPELRSSVR